MAREISFWEDLEREAGKHRKMKRVNLSVIVIAKNEAGVIGGCLESVKWADEVVFLDGGSKDETLEIAKQYPVRIFKQKAKGLSYASWRNQGKKEAQGEWILYLDADERVTPPLKEELQFVICNLQYAAFAIPRRNFLLDKELKHGGWYPDYQLRLFKKDKLIRWIGDLHERPEIEGAIGKLENPILHFQPDKIEPAFAKTIRWSEIEAQLLYKAGHPPVVWWRVLRMGATTLLERLIKKQGFRDGAEGFIESIYQAFHTMIIYLRLWEKQITK